MKKTHEDGTTTYNVAMYAKAKDGRPMRGSKQTSEVISTDDYDIDSPTDAEVSYAKELFGDDADIEFFEEEV